MAFLEPASTRIETLPFQDTRNNKSNEFLKESQKGRKNLKDLLTEIENSSFFVLNVCRTRAR